MMEKDEDYLFFISSNTPSSKNGRVWTGEYFIASKATQKWRKNTKYEWLGQAFWFQYLASMLPKPLYIKFTFIRGSRHKFDYINITQGVLDEMKGNPQHLNKNQYNGQFFWVIEDSADEVVPVFGEYFYDKKQPGVIIELLKQKPE